jgi:hypothetical protein
MCSPGVSPGITNPGFASKVLSHSHRALARWSTLAEVPKNRFNGFQQRRAANTFQLNGFSRGQKKRKPLKRFCGFLMRGV